MSGTAVMKVFVQQISTKLFLDNRGSWIQARDEGRPFGNAEAAIEFCVSHKITDVQLLKVSEKGDLYGYLQPFGGNDPDLQSSDLDPAARRISEEMKVPEPGGD